MIATRHLPPSLEALARLDRQGLRKAHAQGRCPTPGDLDGIAEGLILDPAWFGKLRLWRGKVIHSNGPDHAQGFNRIGSGPFEFRRYRFNALQERSAFSDRDIVRLDHDLKDNPRWVRIFHDELVEIHPGLYLACSHLRLNEKLHYACYFALDFRRKPHP